MRNNKLNIIESIITYPIRSVILSLTLGVLWSAISWSNGITINLIYILTILVIISPTIIVLVHYSLKIFSFLNSLINN